MSGIFRQASCLPRARSCHSPRRRQRWLAQPNASARMGNTAAPMYAPCPPARMCCRNPVTTSRRSVQKTKNALASPNATESTRSTPAPPDRPPEASVCAGEYTGFARPAQRVRCQKSFARGSLPHSADLGIYQSPYGQPQRTPPIEQIRERPQARLQDKDYVKMCGIVACYFRRDAISETAFTRATGSLLHRGPDGQRRWISSAWRRSARVRRAVSPSAPLADNGR